MTSRQRLQPLAITGYYEYLSQIHHRVNVAPSEETANEEAMKQTTTTTPNTAAAAGAVIDNENGASGSNLSLTDDLEKQFSNLNGKDVKKWSSADVEKWVEQQCQKFELKKATSEKFQMNGQALVLLTKHDFLRRSSDGGEILYYALQRLINPDKGKSTRNNQGLMRNGSSRQNPRIVELDSDTDEHNSTAGLTSSRKPIVEDPDDPPSLRRSTSDTVYDNIHQQQYSHPFVFNNSHIRQPVFTTPAGVPPAYFHQQQQGFPNAFMYGQHHHHHVHPHMSQQQFYYPHSHPYSHFMHQNHPMMSTPGVLIEVIEDEEIIHPTDNGVNPSTNETSANGASSDVHEQLYLVTINGQRQVMNEDQATQFVAHIHQQQLYQQHQQQQQHFQQAQQHFQQSQQHFQQHQPHFHQQQHIPQQQQHQPHVHQQQQQHQPHVHQQQHVPQQQQQSSQDNVYHSS